MTGLFISSAAVLRSLVAVIVLIVVGIVLSGVLGAMNWLGLVLWAMLLGGIVVGGFLIARAGNLLGGLGAILMPLSMVIAFFLQPPAFVWTGLFFIGAILIALGARADTPLKGSWPITILRVMIGWAWVDNAQDHFLNNWLPDGGGFVQAATGTANRAPLWPIDPLYQGFLKSVVVPNGSQWASLTLCGELAFGLLMAMGLFTPVAALGLLWQSSNYILMRGFIPHGGYTDKTFFSVDLVMLIVLAGLAYGLDASLRRYVPAWIAQTLMGVPAEEAAVAGVSREPMPA